MDRENLRPMPRFVNRFSLVENATYDLPVEGKNATPNIVYCQFPVAISSDSSVSSYFQLSSHLVFHLII